MLNCKKWTLAVCLLLTACATPEEIQAAKEAQMKADYNTCVNDYGFAPKSDAARNCMLQIELAREQMKNAATYNSYYGGHGHFGSGIHYMNH